ncbi:hypothetical protein B0H13DRAFT_2325958 [Mycena leptocephala]|nr:hypothetical protein B0H13DRAFT_2325958 [Mycena leptocephala]
MLLDPFFHLPNLRDGWDHLGSARSLEVMSLTSMMQRSLLPNVLNNRARDMMLQLLVRLHPTEELDAVLEFIEIWTPKSLAYLARVTLNIFGATG